MSGRKNATTGHDFCPVRILHRLRYMHLLSPDLSELHVHTSNRNVPYPDRRQQFAGDWHRLAQPADADKLFAVRLAGTTRPPAAS